MIEKADFSYSAIGDGSGTKADSNVWSQLAELAQRADTDPVLRLLVGEAISNYRNLSGITATIANRYRALVDAVPDAITLHDESGRVLDANAAACGLYDCDHAMLKQRTLHDLNPDLDENFLLALEAAGNDGRSLISSATRRQADGSDSTLELHAQRYLDAEQARIIVVTRSLEARQFALEQVHRSETELRRIMQTMDNGVFVRNREGSFVSVNPAACRILQMSESDLLALRADEIDEWGLVDEFGLAMQRAALPWSRALNTGKATEACICGFRVAARNRIRWISITSVPRLNDEGAVEQIVSICSDITEIKRNADLFAHAQDLNNLGAWQLDKDAEHMTWSSQMYTIFDLPIGISITRERMLSHFTGMDLRHLRQAMENAKVGDSVEITARMTTTIGRRRLLKIRLRGLDPASSRGGIIGSVQDIGGENDGVLPPIAD